MATDEQIRANQENSKESHGPVTPDGLHLDRAEKFAAYPPEKVAAMCRALTLNEKQKDLSLLNRCQEEIVYEDLPKKN